MPFVTFQPDNLRVEANAGESLFEVGRRNGVTIDTSCAGKGNCGLCRVRIAGGEAGLTPFTPVETRHLGNVYFITKERLSCQARLLGDADVLVEIRARG